MLSPEHRARLEQSRKPIDFYLELLDLAQLPSSPEGLPDRISLPSGFAIPIRQALAKTMSDGKERSGAIRWDPSQRKLISRKYKPGTETSTNAATPSLSPSRKNIVFYHTHPSGNTFPSVIDIISAVRIPNRGFIDIVSTRFGIAAMVQTQATEGGRFGFIPRIFAGLKNGHEGIVETSTVVEEQGFGYYKGFFNKTDGGIALHKHTSEG